MQQARVRPHELLLVAPLAWIVAVINDPLTGGTFWPIAAWKAYALRLRPHSEQISYLSRDHSAWANTQWFTSWLFERLWALGHSSALMVAAGAVSVVICLVMYLSARYLGAQPFPALIAVAASVALLNPMVLQGQALALAVGALLVLVLIRRAWWWAPLILVVWANVHASSAFGIVLCCCAAWGAFGLDDRGAWPRGRRALWLAICGAATLVNPIGITTHTYVRVVRSNSGIGYVTHVWEHLSPHSTRAVLALIVVAGASWAAARAGRVWRVLPMLLLFALAAWIAQRNVVWLALAAGPWLALAADRLWLMADLPPSSGRRVGWGLAAGACLLAVAVGNPRSEQWRASVNAGALNDRFLAKVPVGARVFSAANAADQLYLARDARPFVDMRFEQYQASSLRQYRRVSDGDNRAMMATFGCEGGEQRAAWLVAHDREQRDVLRSLRASTRHGIFRQFRLVASQRPWYLYRFVCDARQN